MTIAWPRSSRSSSSNITNKTKALTCVFRDVTLLPWTEQAVHSELCLEHNGTHRRVRQHRSHYCLNCLMLIGSQEERWYITARNSPSLRAQASLVSLQCGTLQNNTLHVKREGTLKNHTWNVKLETQTVLLKSSPEGEIQANNSTSVKSDLRTTT